MSDRKTDREPLAPVSPMGGAGPLLAELATRRRSQTKQRVIGFVILLVTILVGTLGHSRGRWRLVLPLFAAWGLWFLLFGYPVDEKGLAPGWWRLGLVATAVALCTIMCRLIS